MLFSKTFMRVIRATQPFLLLRLIYKTLPQYLTEDNTFSKEVQLMFLSHKAKPSHLLKTVVFVFKNDLASTEYLFGVSIFCVVEPDKPDKL